MADTAQTAGDGSRRLTGKLRFLRHSAGTLLRAPPVQANLRNQVAPGIGRSPNISKLAAALAAYAPAARE
jgi:hypothetical protein